MHKRHEEWRDDPFRTDPIPNSGMASWALLLVNLFMVTMAAFQKWGYAQILALIWWETVIIGFYNVGRILVACFRAESLNRGSFFRNNRATVAFILIGVFVAKFGGFVIGSGMLILFVPALLANNNGSDAIAPVVEGAVTVANMIAVSVGFMFVSHGLSFFRNYIGRREFEHTSILMLLFWPYVRLALMVWVVVASLFAVRFVPALARWPFFAVIVLLLKLLMDFLTHRVEHRSRTG